MQPLDHSTEPAATPDGDVVSLDQVRKQRQARREQIEAERADSQHKLFVMKQDLHRKVLQTTIASGRMLLSDLIDMIKLGIVSDTSADLPCRCHDRNNHYSNWEDLYYGKGNPDPDEDIYSEIAERLRRGGVDDYAFRQMERTRDPDPPAPNTVLCPLLCYGENESPPCAHALRTRSKVGFEDGHVVTYEIAPDPDDIVLKSDLLPCVFLGKELMRVVVPGALRLSDKWDAEDAAKKGEGKAATQDEEDEGEMEEGEIEDGPDQEPGEDGSDEDV